jgi:SAM-dependent methyltransferase
MNTTFKPSGSACPNCRQTRVREHRVWATDTGRQQQITVVECLHCHFAWQWPLVRTVAESVDHATHRYSEAQDHPYYDPNVRRQVAELRLQFVASLGTDGRRLLDVGAGDGAFVEQANAHGWDAWGVDPGAPEHGGERLRRGLVADLPVDDIYDVITLWDVIEHADDPLGLLQGALQHTKPGGVIVIETGNYQSGDRISAGEHWWCYAADHRWYFSPPVLEDLMRELGIRNFVHADRAFRPKWRGTAQYRVWLGGHARNVLRRPLTMLTELQKLLALRRAASAWPRWSGLGIVTIAGRKDSVSDVAAKS